MRKQLKQETSAMDKSVLKLEDFKAELELELQLLDPSFTW